MRSALALGLGALVAAATGIVLVPRLLTSRLEPPVPSPREVAPGVVARPLTSVSIPFSLSVGAIADLANATGPTLLSGTSALPALKQSAEISIAWTLSRSAVAGSGEGGRLVLTTAVAGGATLRGRTRSERTARGPGRTLPRAFTESIDVAADIRVAADPKLNSAWRIEPGFQASASLRQGEARIADLLTLDLRSVLQPQIEASLKQELDTLGARIAGHPFLERAAREIWDRLCTSVKVKPGEGKPGEAQSALWLDIEPKGWSAGRPQVAAGMVTIPLSARTSLSLSESRQAQAECESFPDRLDGVDAVADATGAVDGNGRITLEVGLDLAVLSEAATAEIAHNQSFAADGVSAELDVLRLASLGDAILIAADGRFRQPGLFGASAAGRLYYLAWPKLDLDGTALTLGEVVIEPTSAKALAQPGGGDFSALVPVIARWLAALRFDLKSQLDRLGAVASTAANGLKSPGSPLGIANVTIGKVRLVGFRSHAQGLRLRAEAEASLALQPIVLAP